MRRYYTLTVRTLSPVHIGCGEELTKLDYCYSGNRQQISVMHTQKLFQGLLKHGLLAEFEQNLIDPSAMFSLTRFLADHDIPESEYSAWAKYSYPVNNVSIVKGQDTIRSFVKDAYGCPYVPGSSLKGVLRTAIAYSIIMRDRKRFQRTAEDIKNEISHPRGKRPNLGFTESMLNQSVFHTLQRKTKRDGTAVPKDILNDCMAGMRISDSKPLSSDSLCLCEKNDVNYDGETHTINLLRECLAPETEIVFDLVLDDTLCPFKAEEIADALRDQFEDYDAVFRSHYRDAVKETIHDPAETGEPWLYLGGGTGIPLKTVIYAMYDDTEQAAELTAKLLDASFYKNRPGHRRFTDETGYSPKVWKCTRLHEKLYEMGLCSIRMEERKP